MKTPCEILVINILSQVRALVTIELAGSYGMKGKDIAPLVGTTEAAVSHYIRGIRGARKDFLADYPEIGPFVNEVSRELFEKRGTEFELTEKLGELCTLLQDNEKYIEMYSQGRNGFSCGICYKEAQ